jgi:hypothetical protein
MPTVRESGDLSFRKMLCSICYVAVTTHSKRPGCKAAFTRGKKRDKSGGQLACSKLLATCKRLPV